jgi:hypothetical protein
MGDIEQELRGVLNDIARALRVALTLLVGAGLVLLAGVAIWGTTLFVTDIASGHEACAGPVPLFEGITVESAQLSWRPPIVRCTLTDRAGHSSSKTLWGWGDLATLVALDAIVAAAVVKGARRLRKGPTISTHREPATP